MLQLDNDGGCRGTGYPVLRLNYRASEMADECAPLQMSIGLQ
jgi:hypothetical protein